MSEALSIVAIAVPGAVAALTVGTNVYISRRASLDARTRADTESIRATLDDAGELLHELGYAISEATARYLEWGASFFSEPEKGAASYEKIESFGQRADRLAVRLSIRLGPDHPAAKSFRRANAAVLSIYRRLGLSKRLGEDDRHSEEWEAMKADQTAFQGFAREFVEAAHAAAGARLPAAVKPVGNLASQSDRDYDD